MAEYRMRTAVYRWPWIGVTSTDLSIISTWRTTGNVSAPGTEMPAKSRRTSNCSYRSVRAESGPGYFRARGTRGAKRMKMTMDGENRPPSQSAFLMAPMTEETYKAVLEPTRNIRRVSEIITAQRGCGRRRSTFVWNETDFFSFFSVERIFSITFNDRSQNSRLFAFYSLFQCCNKYSNYRREPLRIELICSFSFIVHLHLFTFLYVCKCRAPKTWIKAR